MIQMTLARWSESLALGVPAIDADHRRLLDAINRLHFLDSAEEDVAALATALGDVLDHTRGHFRREEMLMRLAGYPGYEAHRALHRKAAERAEQWEARCLADPTSARVRIFTETLSDWLLAHIHTEDVKLKPYVENLQEAQSVSTEAA
jgi:hemerythrin